MLQGAVIHGFTPITVGQAEASVAQASDRSPSVHGSNAQSQGFCWGTPRLDDSLASIQGKRKVFPLLLNELNPLSPSEPLSLASSPIDSPSRDSLSRSLASNPQALIRF